MGRRNLLGTMAPFIGAFSLVTPWLLGAGQVGNNVFLLVGLVTLFFAGAAGYVRVCDRL